MSVPDPPGDLVAYGRGRRFWRQVHRDHLLRADEVELLAESCRLLDLADQLRAVADEGPLVVDGRMSPVVVELRQVREQLRKTLGALALPDPASKSGATDDEVASARSRKARRAARARWS